MAQTRKYLYQQGPDTKGVYTIWAKTPDEFSNIRPEEKETYTSTPQTKKESTQRAQNARNLHK